MKILFILLVIYIIFKHTPLKQYIMQWFMRYVFKKVQQLENRSKTAYTQQNAQREKEINTEASTTGSKKTKFQKTSTKDVGEYIDFEEID